MHKPSNTAHVSPLCSLVSREYKPNSQDLAPQANIHAHPSRLAGSVGLFLVWAARTQSFVTFSIISPTQSDQRKIPQHLFTIGFQSSTGSSPLSPNRHWIKQENKSSHLPFRTCKLTGSKKYSPVGKKPSPVWGSIYDQRRFLVSGIQW